MSGSPSTRAERDVVAIRDGDLVVFAAHIDPWVDRMHDASQNIVGSTDGAAVVSHDVVQSLWDHRGELRADELTRDSLLLATRRRSLDHLAAHGWNPPSTDSLAGVRYDSAATRYRVTLAHAAATVIGASNVSLLDLHFRHGLDAAALSDTLGVGGTAAARRLAQLRSELDEAIAAHELWSGAEPRCAGLVDSNVFDATVFEAVSRHRGTCPACAREHRSLVNPAGLFLTAPITTVAPALRQRVLSVASNPEPLSTATAPAPIAAPLAAPIPAIWAATNGDAAGSDPGPGPGSGASAADAPDIDELWASTAGAAPVARSVPVTPGRPPARPRAAAIVGGVAVVLAMLVGGVALAMRGSGGGDRIVVDRGSNSEQPATNEEEPEVRSLGPVPPSTERSTTTTAPTTTAGSTTTSSSAAPATEPPGTPATTVGTQVATGLPPRPTSTSPSTPTSTVASSPVTTTTTTEPPAATSPPIAPPTATTVAPGTTAVTTPPATTTVPTTPPITAASTTTTAPITTAAPTTTTATTTAAP